MPLSARRRENLVDDLLDLAREVEGYTSRWTRAEFLDDRAKQRTLERTLELMGEVASRLGAEAPDLDGVNWRNLTDLRIVLAHHYTKVDPARLWDHATHDVARLRRAVERWLEDNGSP